MTTEAQITANRLNAQKSTGPRTPEGKAISAMNALKHGLLAREGFIRGEDEIDYGIHREYLWSYLTPGAPLEEILANQIIDLTWKLKRCAQDQAEAFAMLFDKTLAGAPEPEEEAERGKIIGRMLVEDFGGPAILERLQRYERRIEGGFYRALHEMRRVFDQRKKVMEEADETFRTNLAREKEDKWEAYKRKMFERAQSAVLYGTPAGATTNQSGETQPLIPELLRQTKPMGEEVSSLKCQVLSEEGVSPRGLDVPASNFTLDTSNSAEGRVRQTNPIAREVNERQVVASKEVSSDCPREHAGETKPIPAGNEARELVAAPADTVEDLAAVTVGS
jgi:hypothetical protein